MKNRNLKIFLFSAAAGIVMTFSACTNATQGDAGQTAKDTLSEVTEEPATEELSERDKLIINRQELSFKDPENPTDFELKHTPQIDVMEADENGFAEVKITIGQNNIIHPTEAKHWIDYLKVWADDKLVAYVEYEAGLSRGYTAYKVKIDGVKTIKAEAGCNIHGIWSSEKTLE